MMGQIIFILLLAITVWLFSKQVRRIRRNIMLGKPEKITGNTNKRLSNMLLVAFGQKKMFKRIFPATMHLFIYVAFLITQIELLEIVIDGLTGQHRIIWHAVEHTALAGLYTFTISFIEILSVLALIATFIFLARRNLIKLPRFHKPEMNGWPKLDGNMILYFEIYLVVCIFMMNAGDQALQAIGVYHHTDAFTISGAIAPMLGGLSEGTLFAIERIGWWGHLIGILIFLNYIPYSKHLHIFLAFPNTFFARLTPKGELTNMAAVTQEVAPMFEEEPEPIQVVQSKDSSPVISETVDDVFGDAGNSEEGVADIFGDAGNSEEGVADIFGDAGSSEEGVADIFGDAGSSEEGVADIFGDAGSSEEGVDDIFGDAGSSEEGVADIFGDAGSSEEGVADIFGDAGSSEEGVADIFGDAGSSEEGVADIFGDAGSSEENVADIFGDAGSSEEGVADIFGDAGSSEENVADIFGDAGSSEESVDDIFGGGSDDNQSVDDIFGSGDNNENVDDIFGGNQESTDDVFNTPKEKAPVAQVVNEPTEPEEEIIKFGASDVFDLSWKSVMDAYTCTECGRCTSMCPANLTGKKLSPRKVMMDVRDRADEIGKNIDAKTHTRDNYDDGKNLFDYISVEELRACTTCNACVEACPVMINPLDIIVELRRNLILDKAESPESWNVMFTNIENNGAPWQFSASDRDKWIEEIEA